MEKFYVGLATGFHDPAVAVVNSRGEIVFAEASERYFQDKRALGCAADVRATVRRLMEQHCDPRGEYLIAKAWSRASTRVLDLLYLLGVANHERLPRRKTGVVSRYLADRGALFASVWQQHAASHLSGGHFADILLRGGNSRVRYTAVPHHLAHAASGCYTSPFATAACMVVDGQGEAGSISYFDYRDGRIRPLERMRGAESLGLLYAFCTALCGFVPEKGEYWKMMALAAYGKPDAEIHDTLRSLVRLEGTKFRYPSTRFVRDWVSRMRRWARPQGAPPHVAADLACTTQQFYSEVMHALLTNFHRRGISDNLVLAGGCALNSSYNGQITGRTGFTRLHVPSAPADDGTALGAALLAFFRDHPGQPPAGNVGSPYLGSTVSSSALENLDRFGCRRRMRHLPGAIQYRTAELLAEGKVVGWIRGRAEFGPRALGNRSILADPREEGMKTILNDTVKFREGFRPFAPSILDECGPDYFEDYEFSPYMSRSFRARAEVVHKIPAVVHVDGTSRLQSVRRDWNQPFYDLIRAFGDRTGVPMVLNTSLNAMGQPIVHSVEGALGLFYTTGLDALVIEDYLIEK
jgi:carbamoyltransferase